MSQVPRYYVAYVVNSSIDLWVRVSLCHRLLGSILCWRSRYFVLDGKGRHLDVIDKFEDVGDFTDARTSTQPCPTSSTTRAPPVNRVRTSECHVFCSDQVLLLPFDEYGVSSTPQHRHDLRSQKRMSEAHVRRDVSCIQQRRLTISS